MSETTRFKTDQEQFWAGHFGDSYTERNQSDSIARSNLLFWANILKRTGPITSCFELGCNRGLNLDAIKTLLPSCKTSGLEINSYAANQCTSKGHQVLRESILSISTDAEVVIEPAEMSLIAGVLIHICPESLQIAYDLLYSASCRYMLVSEYFNPDPVEIPYRGHSGRLFKRDFAREIWAKFPKLTLMDYGFVWSQDPIAPKDDLTWFLFQK